MNKETEISISKEVTPRGKKLVIYLLDAVATFLLSFFLFLGGIAIYTSLDSYKNDNNLINAYVNDISSLVVESKLSKLETQDNGVNKLLDVDEMAKLYTDHLFYNAAILLDEENKNLDDFKDIKPTQNDDVLYFYYSDYYVNNKEKYESYNEGNTVNLYQNKLLSLIENDKNNYLLKDNLEIKVNPTVAKEYVSFLKGDNKTGRAPYHKIRDAYSNILNETVKDYASNFKPYVELSKKYDAVLSKQDNQLLMILIFTYVGSILSYFLLFPLIFKDGRTPFMKLFKTTLRANDMQEVKYYQVVGKGFVNLILYIPFTLASALIVLGMNVGLSVLMKDFLGIFNLFALGTMMILLLICSIFFTFFRKEKKQTFSEALSGTYMYDVNVTTKIEVGDKTFEIK